MKKLKPILETVQQPELRELIEKIPSRARKLFAFVDNYESEGRKVIMSAVNEHGEQIVKEIESTFENPDWFLETELVLTVKSKIEELASVINEKVPMMSKEVAAFLKDIRGLADKLGTEANE